MIISDDALISCSVNSVKAPLAKKSITYRKIMDIDITAFKENLVSSELMQDATIDSAHLDFISKKYNSSLSKLLDHQAPSRTKVVIVRPRIVRGRAKL